VSPEVGDELGEVERWLQRATLQLQWGGGRVDDGIGQGQATNANRCQLDDALQCANHFVE
jgi:hypothetical protein